MTATAFQNLLTLKLIDVFYQGKAIPVFQLKQAGLYAVSRDSATASAFQKIDQLLLIECSFIRSFSYC
jgi:hypothetical protein